MDLGLVQRFLFFGGKQCKRPTSFDSHQKSTEPVFQRLTTGYVFKNVLLQTLFFLEFQHHQHTMFLLYSHMGTLEGAGRNNSRKHPVQLIRTFAFSHTSPQEGFMKVSVFCLKAATERRPHWDPCHCSLWQTGLALSMWFLLEFPQSSQ